MKTFLISPPFGWYFHHPAASRVLGSYTLFPRTGRFLKIAQFLYDNLRHPVRDGWRNRIGLRNPGVESIDRLGDDHIASFVGLEEYDWEAILFLLATRGTTSGVHGTIELNLGCFNVHRYSIPIGTLVDYCRNYQVIVKLPADMKLALAFAERCAEAGAMGFHAGNTVLDNPGCLSGYPAKHVNLPICEELAKRYPNIPIIGGGGIYTYQDLLDYRNAGATQFSMATGWFHPWRMRQIIERYEVQYALPDSAKLEA